MSQGDTISLGKPDWGQHAPYERVLRTKLRGRAHYFMMSMKALLRWRDNATARIAIKTQSLHSVELREPRHIVDSSKGVKSKE